MSGAEPLDEERIPDISPDDERDELAGDQFEAGVDVDELESGSLLSFYDRLRRRVLDFVERKSGRLGERTVSALMMVPDIFMLLVRLVLDRDVPQTTRALIGGALAYFVLPLDLLPESVLGPIGYMDDLVLAVAVLANAFGDELEPYARRHWSGSQDLRQVLRDILDSARALLGDGLYERIRRLLARRGVKLDSLA